MSGRAKFWWTLAAVSFIVNGGGAWYALVLHREWMHGGIHVAAFALTAYLIAIFRPRTPASVDESLTVSGERMQPDSLGDPRMEQLQQSVDAIAVEVERIGEAQRFNAKLAAQRGQGTSEQR
jgi:hypothetical protein